MTLTPGLRRPRQMEFYEFKVSRVYIESSRTVKTA